jgi:predicted pyridoxine 5'-phosphate oxidase superfamily flavin-nucleotide-binding protein
VRDAKTIGVVDETGTRQFISSSDLGENPKACLFLIECAHRWRIKIWGTTRVV